jgi:UDP:flavonoid glycosyltransferase YjiC (YdhE family)
MAHIVLSPFGSSGDLNPCIALGIGLRERGHTVTFAVQEHFVPSVEGQGFAVQRLSGNVVAALAPYATRLLGSMNPLASVNALLSYGILPTLEENIAELRKACGGADLLVTTFGQIAGSFVADLTGIPWASVAFSPVTIPSEYIVTQPQPFPLPPALEHTSNRFQWWLGSVLLAFTADRPINSLRARFRLAPIHESLWLGGASPRFVALACSPALQPPLPDWPHHVHMTGFCFWDTPADWQTPAALSAFLADPRPLVVVTAGSIGPNMRTAFTDYFQTSVRAIRAMGARTLLIGPAERVDAASSGGGDVMALPFVPYSVAFSHAAAVTHHGGIGTTAQALRYGVPSLIVPWGLDQFYSASQVARIGAGRSLLWRQYTVARAQAALTALLRNPHYREAAQSAQAAIALEDGVQALCDALLATL